MLVKCAELDTGTIQSGGKVWKSSSLEMIQVYPVIVNLDVEQVDACSLQLCVQLAKLTMLNALLLTKRSVLRVCR